MLSTAVTVRIYHICSAILYTLFPFYLIAEAWGFTPTGLRWILLILFGGCIYIRFGTKEDPVVEEPIAKGPVVWKMPWQSMVFVGTLALLLAGFSYLLYRSGDNVPGVWVTAALSLLFVGLLLQSFYVYRKGGTVTVQGIAENPPEPSPFFAPYVAPTRSGNRRAVLAIGASMVSAAMLFYALQHSVDTIPRGMGTGLVVAGLAAIVVLVAIGYMITAWIRNEEYGWCVASSVGVGLLLAFVPFVLSGFIWVLLFSAG